jgi:hypothetical protein
MRPLGFFNTDELTAIDNGESETPKFVQEAIKQLERNITANKYNEHNYKEMILKFTHLSTLQQDELLTLFGSYSFQFDGKLGKIPNVKVHLDLKPNAKPSVQGLIRSPITFLTLPAKRWRNFVALGYYKPTSI